MAHRVTTKNMETSWLLGIISQIYSLGFLLFSLLFFLSFFIALTCSSSLNLHTRWCQLSTLGFLYDLLIVKFATSSNLFIALHQTHMTYEFGAMTETETANNTSLTVICIDT